MDFNLTKQQHEMQQRAREFAQKVVAPGAMERDLKAEFPHEIMKRMGKEGLLGINIPQKYGGLGMDFVSYCLAVEEIARVDASVALTMTSHCSLVPTQLMLAGTEEQRKKWIPRMARGESLNVWALTEPQAGCDASYLLTTARRNGSGWVLNGKKLYATQGSVAGTALIMASTKPAAKKDGISAFIVELPNKGWSAKPVEPKLGMRSSDTTVVEIKDLHVPEDALVGRENEAFGDVMKILLTGRIGIAATAVGIARGSFEQSLAYSKTREQFGKKIGEFQMVGAMLADMFTEIEAARWLTLRAAWLYDQGKCTMKDSSAAKLFASEVAFKVSNWAVQIHGGHGYTCEHPVERYLRDAKLLEIGEGTSQIQRIVISHQLRKETYWSVPAGQQIANS
jgi:alkylation response protein AidB-like acyl-CoA dehydrogenase